MTSHASITINLNENNHLNNGNELTLHYQPSLSKRSQNVFFFLRLYWCHFERTCTGWYNNYQDILLINKLHPKIKKRRRGLISTWVILHHDDASAHTSYHVLSTIHNLRYELFRHPPYSPDLAPGDYYLFPFPKKYLKTRCYEDRSALGSSIRQCLNGLSKDDFTATIQQLPERWRKCISIDGR